jgi:hypothetical protein
MICFLIKQRLVPRSLMGPLRGSILIEGLLVVMVRRTKVLLMLIWF